VAVSWSSRRFISATGHLRQCDARWANVRGAKVACRNGPRPVAGGQAATVCQVVTPGRGRALRPRRLVSAPVTNHNQPRCTRRAPQSIFSSTLRNASLSSMRTSSPSSIGLRRYMYIYISKVVICTRCDTRSVLALFGYRGCRIASLFTAVYAHLDHVVSPFAFIPSQI